MSKAKTLLEEDVVLIKLGQRISTLRKSAGFSQNDLAYAIGWDKPNLRKIEKGKTNPTTRTLIKLAKALKMTLSELVRIE